MNTAGFLDTTSADLRFALRSLRKNPGFAFFAVLTIALGLGANAAIFSLVDGVLLKSIGYPNLQALRAEIRAGFERIETLLKIHELERHHK